MNMQYQALKPGAMLSPVPAVLVSCGAEGKSPNALTIAWAGTVCSDPPMCSISVRPERYSHGMIVESGEFVVNLCSRAMLKAADYCGVRSGRDEDKLKNAGLSCIRANGMTFAPAIDGAPLYLSCRVQDRIPLGSHDLFLAKIVHVGVREDLLDESGRLQLEKADLIAYSHGIYHAVGDVLGFFGFSVAAPDVYERRMAALKG